jgi:hypothetical protein
MNKTHTSEGVWNVDGNRVKNAEQNGLATDFVPQEVAYEVYLQNTATITSARF